MGSSLGAVQLVAFQVVLSSVEILNLDTITNKK
jgi:hypothetical protein